MNEYEIFTEKIPHLVGTGYATGNELPIVRMDEEINPSRTPHFYILLLLFITIFALKL